MVKTHKRKKTRRLRGSRTAFWGNRKKHKQSGHKGGIGMAGSGKRADQKKTLVLALYGNKYFGKQGITSKGTKKDKDLRINVGDIQSNLGNYVKRGIAKSGKDGYEINLKDHIILGDGEVSSALFIHAMRASKSAIEKIEKLGGKIFLSTHFAKDKKQNVSIKKTGGEVIVK